MKTVLMNYIKYSTLTFLGVCITITASAENFNVNNTTVTKVYVNGGVDTLNAGTTCIQISTTVSTSCTNSVVAIPNNNAQLLSAVLTAKTTGNKVWMYYGDSGSYHCPGLVFTPCSVISIGLE